MLIKLGGIQMDYFKNDKPVSRGNAIPTWLDGIFEGVTKTASTKKKTTKTASSKDADVRSIVEEALLANDPLMKLQKKASTEDSKGTMYFSRVDPSVTPHSIEAQTKYAAHWAGDDPDSYEDGLEITDDGDKVRDQEEKDFLSSAAETVKRIDKENSIDRDALWEVADEIKGEKTKKTAGKMPAAALEALQKSQKGGKKSDKADDKKDDKKDKKECAKCECDPCECKKDKKDKDKKECAKCKCDPCECKKDKKEKKEASTHEGLKSRYYNRHTMLEKFAESVDKDYGKESHSTQFPSSWYDDIVGEQTNIGNVKEASVDVGLAFSDDPSADGTRADWKLNQMVKQNADETLADDTASDQDKDGYGNELGTVRASSNRMSKTAHYNNRTQGMSDDGPTAPAFMKDPRDGSESDWWHAQVAKSEKFYDKEQSMLGDGKKEMHTDAIDLFKSTSEKKAEIATRQLKRTAMMDKIAKSDKGFGSSNDAEVIRYYAEAYGDKAYASGLDDRFGIEDPKKLLSEIESDRDSRAAARRKKAGVDVPFVKTAQEAQAAPAAQAQAAPAPAATCKTCNKPLVNGECADCKAKAAAAPAPAPAATAPAQAQAGSDLQMRKQARRIVAQTYGEPVKENYGNVGDPDWDASMLTRNAIADSPQPDIIKQLDSAIKNVREALSK